jgi:hypothetical protein
MVRKNEVALSMWMDCLRMSVHRRKDSCDENGNGVAVLFSSGYGLGFECWTSKCSSMSVDWGASMV